MRDRGERNGRTLRHLRRRCQQRGVRKHDLNILRDWADRVVSVGGGRVAITLTRRAATVLLAQGYASGLIERARKRALVLNADGEMITVVIPAGRRGRHYRRDARRRRRRAWRSWWSCNHER
jgi:hypothetical protein